MYSNTNPAELYSGTTWEELPENKFIKTGAIPLQQGGSNSVTIAKANLPAEKVQIETTSISAGPHSHTVNVGMRTGYNDRYGNTAGYVGGSGAKTDEVVIKCNDIAPYTQTLGNGTPISINPEHITIKAWKRLSSSFPEL